MLNKKTFTKQLGLSIREHRLKLGISQQELGLQIFKDKQHIQLIEAGKVTPTTYTYYLISNKLKITSFTEINQSNEKNIQ